MPGEEIEESPCPKAAYEAYLEEEEYGPANNLAMKSEELDNRRNPDRQFYSGKIAIRQYKGRK